MTTGKSENLDYVDISFPVEISFVSTHPKVGFTHP